jgi:uncharacterized membrane protein
MSNRIFHRREALREYTRASLWVGPTVAAVVALAAGTLLSQIRIAAASPFAPFAFQGTADDARNLLITIAGTVVTVIALVLGLTVVALQLSSTQFSPRLLRDFLRDRPTQLVLSVFMAAFVYSGAGLYTVGVSAGTRVEEFPRLAVTGAIVLLFATIGMVVYYADHLAHSLQLDAITGRVQAGALVVARTKPGEVELATPVPPKWAVALAAPRSGYVETAHPERLLPVAARHGTSVLVRPRVGEHVVAGTVLAWLWAPTAADAPPDPAAFRSALAQAVRIGFERTLEQDVAFGIRQLVDIACKASSSAVSDPYTAVQAIDHLTVIFCALAVRPLGDDVAWDDAHGAVVIVRGRRFGEYLSAMCGLIRRYGSHEPTVVVALLTLLADCASVLPSGSPRLADLREQADLIIADAEREVRQPADLRQVHDAATRLAVTVP